MSHHRFSPVWSPAAALLAAALANTALQAQAPRPQVAPPGREDIYRRTWDIRSTIKGGTLSARWMADGNSFWFAEDAPDRTVISKFDPATRTKTPLFDTPRLRAALTTLLGRELPYSGLPFETFSFVDRERAIRFTFEGEEFAMPLATYAIARVTPPSRQELAQSTPRVVRVPDMGPIVSEMLSPDRRWLIGEKDFNVYIVRSTYDGREVPLTTDGVQYFEWRIGGYNYVRPMSAKWSPDSSRVAVIKYDERDVVKIPLPHYLKQNDEVHLTPLSKAGTPIGFVHLFILDLQSRQQVKAQLPDDEERYLNPFGWLPDGSEFLFYRTSRDYRKVTLFGMHPRTGALRTILEETQPTFIRGIARTPVNPLTLIDGGKRFIYISERDGWDHMYLYNIDGTLIRRLTSGSFPVIQVVDVDLAGGWVYFTAHAEPKAYDIHLYRVGLDGTGFKRLTEADGLHDVSISPSRAYFLDSHSSLSRPFSVDLRTTDGRLVQTMATADMTAFNAVGWKPPEEFIVKAADGKTDLYGTIHKPHDFDPGTKYPVVEHLYAGPLVPWVSRGFFAGRGRYNQMMAELGFIVVTIDGRGSTDRGKAFQDVVYGKFGQQEIPEHVAVLKQVASSRPYMDMSRVGVFGGSYGGYFTLRAMLTAPDVYHVGVAFAPVTVLDDNIAGYIEAYMDLPQNNRAGSRGRIAAAAGRQPEWTPTHHPRHERHRRELFRHDEDVGGVHPRRPVLRPHRDGRGDARSQRRRRALFL